MHDGEAAAKAFLTKLNAPEHADVRKSLRDAELDNIVRAGREDGFIFERNDLRSIAHAGILALELWNDHGR